MTERITRPELADELESLKTSKRAAGSLLLTAVAGLAASFILLFTSGVRAACLVGLVSLGFDLLVGRPARKRRAARLTADQLMFGLGGELSDCAYERKGELAADTLRRLHLSDRAEWPIEAICRQRVSGGYLSSAVSICECSFAVKFGTRKGDVRFISGTLFLADGLDTAVELICIPRELDTVLSASEGLAAQDFSAIESGSRLIDGRALCFTRGGGKPSARLIKGVEKLLNGGDGSLLLSAADGELAVLLQNRFYAARFASGADASAETLRARTLSAWPTLLDIVRKTSSNAV